jgi:predicted phosphohydrolase
MANCEIIDLLIYLLIYLLLYYIMIFQYISDIHLEHMYKKHMVGMCKKILPLCPLMILGGDIGDPYSELYDLFLRDMSSKFETVILICGNHEFYNNYINETLIQVKKICDKYGIVFLHNQVYKYNGYSIIGSTLWSNVIGVMSEINDTMCIKDISVQKYQTMHDESIEFIIGTLTECRELGENVIMLTHHLPSLSLIDEKFQVPQYYMSQPWFATNLDELIETNNDIIKVWIYGHTHMSNESELYGVKMLCNPVGNPCEDTKFVHSKVFELKNNYLDHK